MRSVDILREGVTRDAPAAIRVAFRWTGDEEVRLEGTLPLELPAVDDPSDPTLALVRPSRSFERDDSRPECWRIDRDESEGFGRGLGLPYRDVERGDSVACEAEVWTDHRSAGCLPPGRYAFDGSVYVADWDAVGEWAFELELSEA